MAEMGLLEVALEWELRNQSLRDEQAQHSDIIRIRKS